MEYARAGRKGVSCCSSEGQGWEGLCRDEMGRESSHVLASVDLAQSVRGHKVGEGECAVVVRASWVGTTLSLQWTCGKGKFMVLGRIVLASPYTLRHHVSYRHAGALLILDPAPSSWLAFCHLRGALNSRNIIPWKMMFNEPEKYGPIVEVRKRHGGALQPSR